MLGAYYTMGEPYSERDLLQTTLAVSADALAYETAKADRDKGKITTERRNSSACSGWSSGIEPQCIAHRKEYV